MIVFAWSDRAGRNGIASSTPGIPFAIPQNNGLLIFQSVEDLSGLLIKHDPGLQLVYAGLTLLATGFFLSLYIPRRQVWIKITPAATCCTVSWVVIGRSADGESDVLRQTFGLNQ